MSTLNDNQPCFTQDEYGVVSNSTVTFRAVAEELRMSGSVSLGWTDNAMSHMDVLLVLNPRQVGPSNRMDNRPRKLFIAVAGYGMFGFALDFGEQTFDRTFGLRVRKARNGRQWSQRTLAEELEKHGAKLDPSAVTRIERGTREVKLREAAAIAAALAVPLQELAPPPTASLHEQWNGPLHHAYLGEKLGMRPTMTTEALADLFNGVVAELTAVVE